VVPVALWGTVLAGALCLGYAMLSAGALPLLATTLPVRPAAALLAVPVALVWAASAGATALALHARGVSRLTSTLPAMG
jgi:hypothetical protein